MPWVYYRLYRHYFNEVRFQFVFGNLAPAQFAVCRRLRALAVAEGQSSAVPIS
jgi:hypothetical protein